jgi:hypothetical protein
MTDSPIAAVPQSAPFPPAAASRDQRLSTVHPIAPGQHHSPAYTLNAACRTQHANGQIDMRRKRT